MKLSRFCAFSRRLVGTAAVITLTHQASAQTPLYWKSAGTAAADWGTNTNWSTTAAASGGSPGAAPGITNTANFSGTSPASTAAQTVTLSAAQSIKAIATPAQTATTTIRGTVDTTLSIGNSTIATNVINHTTGGLTIGSSTAGQAVNILLPFSNTWTSSTTGTGAAALVINNNVTGTGAGTLTLDGTNTGSIINGNITGSGSMWVVKWGTGLWTLAGTANTFSGYLAVNEGTLRLTNAGAATPANIYVVPAATLSLRTSNPAGTTGFTETQVNNFRTAIAFDEGGSTKPIFALDTANGSFTYTSTLVTPEKLDPGPYEEFDFKKLGGNTLTLSGNNTGFPGSTIISEGTLALATPNAAPGQITTEANGTLAVVVGGSGFTVPEIEALIAASNLTVGGFGISTANGDVVYSSVLSGSIRFNKTGPATLVMTADNTYAGSTTISEGSLSVSRIPAGGAPSPLGASGNEAANLVLGGGRLVYTGPTLAPERLFSMSTNGTIGSSGTGPLTFAGGTITQSGANARTLTLSGVNQDGNTFASTVVNVSGSTTSVAKTGYGNWTLTGPSTATGLVRGRGGNLTLDYGSVDPWAGGALIQSGTVILKAKAGGTTETMSNLQIGEQHNGLGILKLTGDMKLTVTSLDGNAATQRHNLIDLSNNGGSISVTALNANATFSVANNGLLNNNAATATNARANVVLRANDNSYGFAALAPGTTTGLIQKLAFVPAGVLTPGTVTIDTNTTNYYLGAGSYTTSGTAVFSTLTLDSALGAVNFALGGTSTFNPSSAGKAILATGANDVTISGGNTTSVLNQPLWVHNYVDPSATFNISSNMGTGGYFIIGGTGYTNYSGIGLGQKTTPSDTQFVLNGGVFRMTTDQDLATPAGVLRVTDGIFEIGADLNGAAAGDFTRASGTAFRLLGNAGFSAYTSTPGGTRVANFSNASPLIWGSTDFLTNSVDNTDGDYAFRLSSPRSNATIQFTNNIDLNGHYRVVEVADGSASTDAVLSGVLSGLAGGLVKTGPGTLALTGANIYGAETRVLDGVLRIQAGSIPAGSRLVIQGTGRVSVVGSVGVQSVVINGVEQGPGAVSSPLVAGNLYVGAAPAGMTYAQWVTNKSLQPAESAELFDADKDGLFNLLEYGLGTEPKVPNGSPITHNAGNSVFRFNRATDRTDISTIIEASESMTGTWSTIATSTGTGAFVLQAGVTGVAIDESTPGTVIVTTSGTAPAKKFHRVRVTK